MIEQKLTNYEGNNYTFNGIDNGSYELISYLKKTYKAYELPKYKNSCVGCKNAMWFIENTKDNYEHLNSYCRIMNAIKFNSLTKSNVDGCAGLNS